MRPCYRNKWCRECDIETIVEKTFFFSRGRRKGKAEKAVKKKVISM